ncbi:Parp12 [Symbiodinium pilosum]|uniref:Poly [ADP-ribose] polymerase n=1 Tax=Symbiodinium pilosum TaxID=2952 RepID=A0A812VD47_SYMPI|nr:Parp12 [Symbiodinium pilosum]
MEKSRTWQKYAAKRAQLRSRQQVGLVEQHPELFAPLETDVNEVYLWHGTHIRSAFAIAHEDFKMGMAGSNGTMYGKGIYFAENSTKADEYARDEPHGFYQDVFALLLCRVCLGKFLYSEERLDTAGDMAEAGTIDSTVGDRTRTANTFREFAAYHPDQVYPEYVVLYSRRPKAVAPEPFKFSLAPLHAQLPIYWQHFHVNPQVDSFEVQYGVRHASRALLEQLAQACYPGRVGDPVISARRIEMSSLWNRYVQFKKRLRDELDASGRSAFASPELLESRGLHAGRCSSTRRAHTLPAGVVQTTISADSLEGDLQEHLLWHGTSRKSAEAIVRADFRVPKDVKNGVRFGCGLYFAEDVGKSLTYAPVNTSSDGRTNSQFLLLCRVLCGQMHYTSERYDLDAVTSAHKVGKHSVLANPLREGPREVIIWHAMQASCYYSSMETLLIRNLGRFQSISRPQSNIILIGTPPRQGTPNFRKAPRTSQF